MEWGKVVELVVNRVSICIALCAGSALLTFGPGHLAFVPQLELPWAALAPLVCAVTAVLIVIALVQWIYSGWKALCKWMLRPIFNDMSLYEKLILHWLRFNPGKRFYYVHFMEELPDDQKLDFQLAVDKLVQHKLVDIGRILIGGTPQSLSDSSEGRLFIQKNRSQFDRLDAEQDIEFRRTVKHVTTTNQQVANSSGRL